MVQANAVAGRLEATMPAAIHQRVLGQDPVMRRVMAVVGRLPGYYRVRVATDVRLIYRRAERQNEVEILSLIDREDLDRYIRQARTRG